MNDLRRALKLLQLVAAQVTILTRTMSRRIRSSASAENANAGNANAESANTEVANAVESEVVESETETTTQMNTLMKMMRSQREMINNLLRSTGANLPHATPNSCSQALKALPISACSGKKKEKTSIKVT